MIRALPAIALALAACTPADGDQCGVESDTAEVRAADRKLLGAGYVYPSDPTMRARDGELRASMALRRQMAWRVVEKVLTSVPLAEPLPGAPDARIPGWQTWYGADDVKRLFQRLYDQLGVDGRRDRARFAEGDMDAAIAWNTTAVDELDTWPASRWDAYVASLDTQAKVAGIGGVAPVLYNAPAARHFLRGYPELVACETGGAPPAFLDATGGGTEVALSESVDLSSCATRRYGPFFVTDGATLRASLAGGDVDGAHVEVESAAGAVACTARGSDTCSAQGPATFTVVVRAGAAGASGTLDVAYDAPDTAWAPCLPSPFPTEAVVVKASWHRANAGFAFPAFDTSAAALSTMLAEPAPEWGDGVRIVDPGSDAIYTMELDNGNVYRLAGLHIMTKELEHWTWTTLWWSDEPDTDFGEDRPPAIDALGGPWANYKMCSVTAFDERDPDATAGFAATAPGLAAALSATHAGIGGASWCSNPYLELGRGNAATNCVGCHQHGGTGLRPEAILADPDTYPAHGRVQIRNNFPVDYSFAADAGDRLGNAFREVVDYYAAAE